MPASLLSIKIRGVRSYSPSESQFQSIDFMPLTLIVGPNGSGKTTIIEALKFIISGEEPPLSDSRRNFINGSSKEFSNTGSYASVELEFRNSDNVLCYAKREISKAVGKNVTPSISSCFKVGNKGWVAVHKQDDWNKTLPALFNLPNQAILNNVILCHQEENLWSMGDSSSVKMVFDKVFGCEQYKKEIRHIDSELKSSKSELDLGEKDLIRFEDRVKRKLELQTEISRIQTEIEKLSLSCEELDSQLSGIVSKKEIVVKDIQNIDSENREAKNLKQKLEDLNNQCSSLKGSLRQPLLDIQAVSDEELERRIANHVGLVQQTRVKQAESRDKIATLKQEISKLEHKRSSIQVKELALVTSNLSKMNLITDRMDETEQVRSLRSLIKDTRNAVDGLMKQMKSDCSVQPEDIEGKIEELDNLGDVIESKKIEMNDVFKEQASLSDNLGRSFETDEEYKKNTRVRAQLKQIDGVKSELSKLVKPGAEDGSIKLEKLKSDLKEIQSKEYGVRDKRAMFSGSVQQLERQLKALKSEFSSLAKVNRDYAECLGKVTCNRIVYRDLVKLKQCFQQSIITFHDQMITKINDALRTRWRQIYQGDDIQTIELVDEEVTKGKDKKINYYIAMRKNGVRMQMRQKSSAGQKALASIILRITLAELFVKDFAFIALDEPTANLDLANVNSLAKAIGSYVRRRATTGANIQWIIITHDEQFLKALDSECSPFFYRVSMGSDGCSKIVKLSSLDLNNDLQPVLAEE